MEVNPLGSNYKNLKRVSHSDFQKLLSGFEIYDNIFCNHCFKYIYLKPGQGKKSLIVHFNPENFLHLTGCTVFVNEQEIKGKRFYQSLEGSKINNSNVFYTGRYTKPKLNVLPKLDTLLSPKHVRVIEKGNFLRLQFDAMVRTNKTIGAALAFINTGSYFEVPESLINLKVDNIQLPSYNVIDIIKDPEN